MTGQRATTYVIALSMAVSGVACEKAGFLIPDRVSCNSCEIEVTTVATIGADDGPASLVGRPTHLVQDSLGRYWIGMLDYGFPYIYSADGSFIQQFGQPGQGPGEFQYAAVLAGLPGDSVLLSAGLTYLVVSPELEIARRVARAPRGQLTGLRVGSWPDDVVGLGITYDAGQQSSDVQHLDMSGERILVRSTQAAVGGSSADMFRLVEPAGSQRVWVSDVARYVQRLYGSDGSPLDSLQRNPDWFPPGEALTVAMPTQAPMPTVGGLRTDPDGRLWVVSHRARTDWSRAWEGVSFPTGVAEVRVSSLPPSSELWTSVVEVIDVDRRRVVARKELDGYVFAILAHDLVATFVELETGIPIVTVHRLRLHE